jgi:HlyD family secretion protein
MKKRKRIWWVLAAVVAVVLIAWAIASSKEKATEVTIQKAEIRSLTEKVLASGKIQPETEVKIQSQISGQIIELPVKEGDLVQAGQVLVKINPDVYIAALNRSAAALNSAKSNLFSAKARFAQSEAQFKNQDRNYTRQKKLFEDKAISQAEMDQATSAFESAKADLQAATEAIHSAEFAIESAQASANEANDNLKRTTIMSPMTGTVTALTKEIGETVLGNNMMSGDVVMRISALNSMEVNVEVNESDIVRVKLGDTAIVKVDAYQDREFKGIVAEIGNTALNALNSNSATLNMDQVTNFSVKVRILSESYSDLSEGKAAGSSPFRPGMSAKVEIETAHASGVLTIPVKCIALREDTSSLSDFEKFKQKKNDNDADLKETDQKPFTVVFVYNSSKGKAEIRIVKTGIQDDRYIHILEGLQTGEEVITGPYEEVSRKLKNGHSVVIKKKEEENSGSNG